jgi:hypothetical protein
LDGGNEEENDGEEDDFLLDCLTFLDILNINPLSDVFCLLSVHSVSSFLCYTKAFSLI